MSEVDTLTQLSNIGVVQPQAATAQQSVGQTEFLQLMLAQFENQDPFEPMENGEFLSQLAEFSTASGIEELQSSFADFSSSIYADQALQASSLVGRQVLVQSDLARTDAAGDGLAGAVELEQASGQVTVDVLDASGQLVRTIDLGVQAPGTAAFRWDGLLASGEPAAAGIYQLQARVARGDQIESVPTLIGASVDSVALNRNGGGVRINSRVLGDFAFSQIRQIF